MYFIFKDKCLFGFKGSLWNHIFHDHDADLCEWVGMFYVYVFKMYMY
jgi:hypothetical protein